MFYVTHEVVVQCREDHGIYEDLNPHLLTLTQLAEESTALTVCPFEDFIGGHLNFGTFNKKRTHLVRASTGTGNLFRQSSISHYAEEVYHIKYLLQADVMYIETEFVQKKNKKNTLKTKTSAVLFI